MMNRFRSLQIILFALGFVIPLQSQDILMTIGDKEISLAEFERIYKKNNNDLAASQQSPEEYLDLFVNFKLKVLEAENRGMDTTSKFINEFTGYKNQLAKPYLVDEETREKMIREAYERSKYDLNASHILIGMSSRPSPEDTVAKYNRALEIRERIINGEDFYEVARATSDDPSAKQNGGKLGYFTVFDMMYPFESGIYSLDVGEISMPIRTLYGYHIVKLEDKRPAMGQLKVAHIFIATPPTMSESDRLEAKEEMQSLSDSVKMGVDFGELARRHSDDRNSAVNGGELPWFGNRRMIPEFEHAALALEKGEVSEPFSSNFGWHLVKLIDRKGIGTYEEMKPSLETKALKGDREREERSRFYNKLKERYNYQRNEEVFGLLYAIIDSSYIKGEWDPGKDLLESEKVLFSLKDTAVSLGAFLTNLYENQKEIGGIPQPNLVELRYTQFLEPFLMEYEKSTLPERFPEYRYILQEYHDGILLFDIMDQEVWSKAVQDTTGLEAFYEDNKENYMWGERVSALIVTCDSTADVSKVYRKASRVASGRWDEDKLNDKFCVSDTVRCITVEKILVEKGENEKVDAIAEIPGQGSIFQEKGNNVFIVTTGIVPPEPKALNETRGKVTSDYQDYLEQQWISELREKYPVKVNEALLKKIDDQ